jgi:hypothetical protein
MSKSLIFSGTGLALADTKRVRLFFLPISKLSAYPGFSFREGAPHLKKNFKNRNFSRFWSKKLKFYPIFHLIIKLVRHRRRRRLENLKFYSILVKFSS